MTQEINPQGCYIDNTLKTTLEMPYYVYGSYPTFSNMDILQEAIKVASTEHFHSANEKADFVIETYKKFKKTLNEN